MTPSLARVLFAGFAGSLGPLLAQSFTDLTEVRNPAAPFPSLFQLELGAIGISSPAAANSMAVPRSSSTRPPKRALRASPEPSITRLSR